MPRPTGRGFGVLGLAAGTYLAGRVIGTWELYLLAFAFAAVFVISWLLVALTGRRIRVTRVLIPERPVAGDEPEYIVTVKNASLLPGPAADAANRHRGAHRRRPGGARSRAWARGGGASCGPAWAR